VQFTKPRCPECGERPANIEERMLTNMRLMPMPTEGEYAYTGEYDDDCESVEPNIVNGQVALYCDNEHQWHSAIVGQEGGADDQTLMAMATLAVHKMSVRWSYHKKAWVASMLHVETGNECQFVAPTPTEAIEGAHKKATTARKAKK
jgi:hypothetical protein